ncbi:MerR family transcriptional regulator [Streptomyces stramineus]|uniref:MerR family transcriptional regulator n=1 Tax=Streptomyces stramineus TaxID=173861 RepID=A0ABP3L695_9ACTN
MSISTFARRVGIAPSALRFYDDCRILRPARVDAATGYRSYSPGQEARARLLGSLREAGLPLAEVALVLDGPEETGREVLELHLGRMRERTEAARAAVAAALRALSGTPEDAPARVRLSGAELAGAIRQVVPAAAPDAEYPVLGCVLVEADEGEVRLVATDRYRLSVRVLQPLEPAGPPAAVLVPADALVELGQWAARSAEVTLETGPDGCRLTSAAGARELPTMAGEFPMYREVLAAMAPPAHRVIVSRTALRDAAGAFGETPAVTLAFGRDEVTVAPHGGTAATVLPAICQDGPAPLIGFDPAVLAAALETSVGPDVLLEIASVTTPVVVRSADQGSFTTLVMPVALEYVR